MKESLRQRDRVATQEELSRDDALQRIDELESGIRKKVRWQACAQLEVRGFMVDVRCLYACRAAGRAEAGRGGAVVLPQPGRSVAHWHHRVHQQQEEQLEGLQLLAQGSLDALLVETRGALCGGRQDKERQAQTLTKTLLSQQHKLTGLRNQVRATDISQAEIDRHFIWCSCGTKGTSLDSKPSSSAYGERP